MKFVTLFGNAFLTGTASWALITAKSSFQYDSLSYSFFLSIGISGLLATIPNRTKETLLSVVKECIRPGSIFISDCWKSYENIPALEGYNFQHLTVNHSKIFRDPITGAHTNTIEGLWALAKRKNKNDCGTNRNLLDSYICEFIWRQRDKNKDLFMKIIEDIASFMPPIN